MIIAVTALALTTFKEMKRQPSIWVIYIAGLLITLILPAVTIFAIGNEKYLLFEYGISTIEIGGLLLAIFGSLRAVAAEIENKTILVLLSKPISRFNLIIGKFFGVLLVIFLYHLILSFGLIIAFYWWHSTQGIEGSSLYRDGFLAVLSVEGSYIIKASYLLLLQNSIMTATLISCSVFLPVAGNALVGIIIFLLGQLSDWLNFIFSDVFLFSIFVKILPDFRLFDITNLYSEQVAVPISYLFAATFSGIIYTLILLLPGIWILRRRDFN